jgi:hypothetical protein
MLPLQFAFVTHRLPDDTKFLPKTIEIMAGGDLSRLPAHIRFTLVHCWLARLGEYETSYALYDPSGRKLDTSDDTIRHVLTPETKPWVLDFHHVEMDVDIEGRFEVEAICDGEVAVRYPFHLWLKNRSS